MRRFLVALFLLCPALALAQEAAADAPLSGGADTALTLYAALGTVITALLGWISVRVSAWLKAKTKNESIGGALARLTDSVFTAVKLVNQTLKREIEAAKAVGSAGGTAITASEAQHLKDAVWAAVLAEYGGMGGLTKALGVLGLSGDGLTSMVNGKIEAAVHDTKVLASPQKPAS